MSHGRPLTSMYIVLYRTTAKCATQCTAKIFFARIATSNTAYPVHNPTRKLQHHQSMYGRNIFRPYRKPSPPHTCSQPVPSAPTPSANVRAKHFSPESQPATPHTLFATRPVSPNTTNQCRGEIFFARIATSNTAYPVLNPTRKPQHHQST